MKDDPLKDKSYQFAIRVVKLSQYLQLDKKRVSIEQASEMKSEKKKGKNEQ